MGIPVRKMTGVCEITTGQMHDVSLPPAFEGEAGAIEVKVTLEYGGAAASVSGLAAGMYLYDPYADTMTDEVGMSLSGNAASGVMPGAFFAACGCPLLCLTLTDPATGQRMVAGSLPLEVQNVCGSSVLTMRTPTPSEVVYIGRAPYIGADNRWWVWDNETHAYRNSGVLCVGTGVASVNGIKADKNGNADVLALNLLDNSDWRIKKNIVNYRGGNYETLQWQYFIDRWIIAAADGTSVYYDINETERSIGFSTASGSKIYIVQRHPVNTSVINGKVYTLAYKKRYGGEIVCLCTSLFEENEDWIAVAFEVPSGTYIEWLAMYEGEYDANTLPHYVSKPPSVELMECERYCRKYLAPAIPCANNPAGKIVTGMIYGNLRYNPTVVCNDLYFFYGSGLYSRVVSATAEKAGSGVRISFLLSDDVPSNLAGIVGGTQISLNANL